MKILAKNAAFLKRPTLTSYNSKTKQDIKKMLLYDDNSPLAYVFLKGEQISPVKFRGVAFCINDVIFKMAANKMKTIIDRKKFFSPK